MDRSAPRPDNEDERTALRTPGDDKAMRRAGPCRINPRALHRSLTRSLPPIPAAVRALARRPSHWTIARRGHIRCRGRCWGSEYQQVWRPRTMSDLWLHELRGFALASPEALPW